MGARLPAYDALRDCSALLAVTTDPGHRRGLRRELSVTIEDNILRHAHGARRTPPASPHVAGGAHLARLRAELLRSRCGGIAAARASTRCHLKRRRRLHPSSQAYGAECDIFLWLSPPSECVLTHAHLSNSIDIHRDGKGYAIERMSSCAQSAQLVVCSADSHTLIYDRKGVPARARTALWWSSGERVRLVYR